MANALKTKCKACNKSSLSLLLLRPSPIAKSELVPTGSDAIKVTDALHTGLLPAGNPTKSRTVLRLLRTGYLHVYIPNPPKPVFECPAYDQKWHIYRITDNADLIEEHDPLFSQSTMPAVCTRKEHNPAGMRTLALPKGFESGDVWLAYSANLWDETLKNNNAANPQVMQKIVIGGNNLHAFKPTAENLKQNVMEAGLKQISIPIKQYVPDTDKDPSGKEGLKKLVTVQVKDTTYPFNPISANDMAKQLERVAAAHPNTKGKELAVVLADPVGYAAELNDIRVLRHTMLQAELEKPENVHALNSSSTLMGIKESFLDAEAEKALYDMIPLCYEFELYKYPADSKWYALTRDQLEDFVAIKGDPHSKIYLQKPPNNENPNDYRVGMVIKPTLEKDLPIFIQHRKEYAWGKLSKYYNEGARQAWINSFTQKMEAQHYAPLRAYETDWFDAIKSPMLTGYFIQHFNAECRNHPVPLPYRPCMGTIYAREADQVMQPAPYSEGKLQEEFLALLDLPMTNEKAVIKRALMGNQQTVISVAAELEKQVFVDKRDKFYDILKGVLQRKEEKIMGSTQYSWMMDSVANVSVRLLTAVSSAASAVLSSTPFINTALAGRLNHINIMWGVQRVTDYMAVSALKGKAPPMSILVYFKVDPDELLKAIKNGAKIEGVSKKYLKEIRKQNKKSKGNQQITIAMLTDTDTVKQVHGDAKKLINQDAQMMGNKTAKTLAVGGTTLALTQSELLTIYAKSSQLTHTATNAIRNMAASNVGQGLKNIAMSMDGRLAFGSTIIQGLGLLQALKDLDTKTGNELRDAWYGVMDGTAGVIGGTFEMWAVAAEVGVATRLGQSAVASSGYVASLKVTANIAGAAGGIVMGMSNWAKAKDAEKAGNIEVMRLYKFSALSFGGTFFTTGTLAAGTYIRYRAAQRGASMATISAAAYFAEGAAFASALNWAGIILLGAGVVFQITAEMIRLNPMEKWISRSYFGTTPLGVFEWDGLPEGGKFPQGQWGTEKAALEALLAEARAAVKAKP